MRTEVGSLAGMQVIMPRTIPESLRTIGYNARRGRGFLNMDPAITHTEHTKTRRKAGFGPVSETDGPAVPLLWAALPQA